jgi:hypothetical protein
MDPRRRPTQRGTTRRCANAAGGWPPERPVYATGDTCAVVLVVLGAPSACARPSTRQSRCRPERFARGHRQLRHGELLLELGTEPISMHHGLGPKGFAKSEPYEG